MKKNKSLNRLEKLLEPLGIRINGKNPWDIQVRNEHLANRLFAQGSLAFGESYMEGWWDCAAIDQLINKALNAGIEKKVQNSLSLLWTVFNSKLLNLQSKYRAFEVGKKHYDLGNDLFEQMLDKRMMYSCAYWKNARTLDEAQEAKLQLIAGKLKLESGMTVLDIGCGWGGLAKYLTENYGVQVLGITISKEQAKLAEELCKGLPVNIRIQDYRSLEGKFDRIVSVGMFEHVGVKNYPAYFNTVNRCLKEEGIFLLHTIGLSAPSRYGMDPWLDKYIFPNAYLPSTGQIVRAFEPFFKLEDWHNFGDYYDRTLMCWYDNFNRNWQFIQKNYDNRFFRMWNYYLLSCAATFRSGKNSLWQVVLTKPSKKGIYESIR